MTNLVLTVRGLDGNVIPNTQFKVSPAFPDDTYNPETSLTEDVVFTTDSLGVASLSLPASTNPYYVTRAVMNTDGMIAYKLFVPATAATLTLGMVYVDLKSQLKLTNDKALYTMVESKVSMLVALEQARTAATAAGLNASIVVEAKDAVLAANTDQFTEGLLNLFYTAVRDAAAKNRANHTGTQLAATISDLAAAIAAHAPVTSVNGGTGAVVLSATDVGAVPSSDVGSTVCELSGGLVPTNRIPAIAIVQFLGTVASQAAMLALNGQQGDWCIRSDTSMVYILVDSNPALLSSWQALSYPAAPVTTVNGQAGAVVLGYSDVGADAAGAAATAQAVAIAYSVQRGNHTGTQLAATISDFATAVAAASPVASVNSRTGAVTTMEAIIENLGKQAFIGSDCLEDPSKSPFTIATSNATLAIKPVGNGMADATGVWKWTGSGMGDIACGAFLSGGASGAILTLSAEPVVLVASFSKTSALSRERVVLGAYTAALNGDTSFGGDAANGFCISLDDGTGTGQWNFRTTSGGVTTNIGTISNTPFVDDTRYTCVIVATSSVIKYYVNGILKATHTTNIPTGSLHVGVAMYQVAGGSFQGGNFYLDLFRFGRVYKTTPRNLDIPSVTY